jgi:Kef-type K+ transport system membrane component KefB
VSNVLSLAGLIISGVVVILFVADLAAAFPFQRVSVAADIGFILAGLLVAYLSWSINARAKA